MGDGLFNKFKILIGVEDAEEEREVQTVSAAPVAPYPPARRCGEHSLLIRTETTHLFSREWIIIGKIRW